MAKVKLDPPRPQVPCGVWGAPPRLIGGSHLSQHGALLAPRADMGAPRLLVLSLPQEDTQNRHFSGGQEGAALRRNSGDQHFQGCLFSPN